MKRQITDKMEENGMEQSPIRVLHIVGSIHPGGMENFIMNLYRHIDRERIQFDFVVHMKQENAYTEEIRSMGGRIYELPRLTARPLSNLRQLYRLVKENRYRVVVRHTPNALIAPQIYAAKWAGAKVICHSHNTTDPQKTLHRVGRFLLRFARIERFACSKDAGKWMFGKRGDVRIVHNAIDIDRFCYSEEADKKIRQEFGIGNGHVYGHVANFIASKNHLFLMQIYKQISMTDKDARFFCIGDGELREQVKAEAERLGLTDRVFFTGIRYDVRDFMSCMDVLIFPSVFEGLPLTLIEAQAAGLPCLISDTVTKDVEVTKNLICFYSLAQSPECWAERAKTLADYANTENKKERRACQREKIAAAGYDIEQLSAWYTSYFTELAR